MKPARFLSNRLTVGAETSARSLRVFDPTQHSARGAELLARNLVELFLGQHEILLMIRGGLLNSRGSMWAFGNLVIRQRAINGRWPIHFASKPLHFASRLSVVICRQQKNATEIAVF